MIRKLEKNNIDFEKKIEELAILEKNIFGESAYSLETLKDFFKNSAKRYKVYIKELVETSLSNPDLTILLSLESARRQHPVIPASNEAGELKIVAYLIALDNLDSYDILKIAIDKNYRNIGIGEELLEKISDKNILLEVRESNLRAIKFYEKNSFTKISTRKNYYKDNNEKAIIMMREASVSYE
ncbi:MAG: GNAT family N-acetyltransferase [Fusobacterium sp.]|nr:GNAT family N-acetyltransferase [Fusobacterium sp.]